jgi:hypothetical protein
MTFERLVLQALRALLIYYSAEHSIREAQVKIQEALSNLHDELDR